MIHCWRMIECRVGVGGLGRLSDGNRLGWRVGGVNCFACCTLLLVSLFVDGRVWPHVSKTVPLAARALQQALDDSMAGMVE